MEILALFSVLQKISKMPHGGWYQGGQQDHLPMDQVEPANGQYSHISEERYKRSKFYCWACTSWRACWPSSRRSCWTCTSWRHDDHLPLDHVEPVHLVLHLLWVLWNSRFEYHLQRNNFKSSFIAHRGIYDIRDLHDHHALDRGEPVLLDFQIFRK